MSVVYKNKRVAPIKILDSTLEQLELKDWKSEKMLLKQQTAEAYPDMIIYLTGQDVGKVSVFRYLGSDKNTVLNRINRRFCASIATELPIACHSYEGRLDNKTSQYEQSRLYN